MRRLFEDARSIFEAAVNSVQADKLLSGFAWQNHLRKPVDAYRQVYVVGMGKAAIAMASVVEQQLGAIPLRGVVVAPEGYSKTLPPHFPTLKKIEVLEGGHPIPDKTSVQAARRILTMVSGSDNDDLVVVLLSGGGTALCTSFVEPISLSDAQLTFRLLLEAGADIHEMNTVRKHLSNISGGRLAATAFPAELITLVISDVIGDDLSVIASGPTVPDPTTFEEAIAILHQYRLWNQIPSAVQEHLESGLRHPELENPKPGDPRFDQAHTLLLGNNRHALQAAAKAATERDYSTSILDEPVKGEAREAGKVFAKDLLRIHVSHPVCFVSGGETTVTVRGNGLGGRNQEFVLAAALTLEKEKRSTIILSGGTDGKDGVTRATGAWTTAETARAARLHGILPEYYLANNDSFQFFGQLNQLVITGPTHTNVMDVQVGLIIP